jgi:hypothetical protein
MKEQRAHKMYVDYIYLKAHKLIGSEYATVSTFVPSQWPRFEDWTVLSICKMHLFGYVRISLMHIEIRFS